MLEPSWREATRDGDRKYLEMDGSEYLFNISGSERKQANQAMHELERLARNRLIRIFSGPAKPQYQLSDRQQ